MLMGCEDRAIANARKAEDAARQAALAEFNVNKSQILSGAKSLLDSGEYQKVLSSTAGYISIGNEELLNIRTDAQKRIDAAAMYTKVAIEYKGLNKGSTPSDLKKMFPTLTCPNLADLQAYWKKCVAGSVKFAGSVTGDLTAMFFKHGELETIEKLDFRIAKEDRVTVLSALRDKYGIGQTTPQRTEIVMGTRVTEPERYNWSSSVANINMMHEDWDSFDYFHVIYEWNRTREEKAYVESELEVLKRKYEEKYGGTDAGGKSATRITGKDL